MNQQDFDQCLQAVSAALEVMPEQPAALELKRRAMLKKKMSKRISKESAPAEVRAQEELDPSVAELLEHTSDEIAGGSLQSALRTLTFFLEIDPDNPRALELREQAEGAVSEQQRSAEAVAETTGDVPSAMEATQVFEDGTQIVHDVTQVVQDVAQAVQAEPTTADVPRRGFQIPAVLGKKGLKWLGGSVVVVLLAIAAIRLAGPVADMQSASLVLNVAPWANVDSITEIDSGEPVPISEGLSTPCVVPLSPGTYRVQVSNPNFEQPLQFDVTVLGGDTSVVQETLPSFNLEEELLRVIEGQPGS